jgi:hypothetical protein
MIEMSEEEKTSKWASSLEGAGLLDEIEDGWSLPEPSDGEPVIRVEGRPADQRGAGPDDARESIGNGEPEEDVPFGVPVPSVPPPPEAEAGGLQKTPLEQLRSSAPVPAVAEEHGPGPMSGPFRKSSSPPWADEQSVPPEAPPDKARSTMPFADDEPSGEEGREAEEDMAAFVEVRGRRISVAPEPWTDTAEAGGEILDEPPSFRDSSATIEEGVLGVVDGGLEAGGKPRSISDKVFDMQEHFEMGDYSRALELAEQIIEEDESSLEALACREASQKTLMQMYESRIGSLGRVPVVAIDAADVIWRNLDPAAGFVLSRVDGICTFEDVVDISGLPRFETFRILNQLLQDGIIE